MSHIEFQGKIYCDWRLTIENCEGSEFFKIIYIYGEIVTWIGLLHVFACIFIRRFAFGETWKSFLKGENALLLFISVISFCFAAQFLSVLLAAPHPAPGILWTFLYPLMNLTMSYHMTVLLRALPEALLAKRITGCLSDRARSYFFLGFASFLFITHIVIISLAQSLAAKGQVSLGRRLERVGLAITTVNGFFFIAGLSYSCLSLKNRIEEVLVETKGVEKVVFLSSFPMIAPLPFRVFQIIIIPIVLLAFFFSSFFQKGGTSEFDNSLLGLVAKKLQQHLFFIIINGALEITFFMLLAVYPSLFINLPFSKALATIMIAINLTNGLISTIFFCFFDIKKWFHQQVKESSSKGLERRGEATPTPVRMSISEKDRVELIIDDLRPKEPSLE